MEALRKALSNRLTSLVYGAKPFGTARTGPTLRAVLLALADAVNEGKHVDWCFPSRSAIQERTEFCERTVKYALQTLAKHGWITIKERPGYGNAYHFDLAKLETNQRPKRERVARTRAFNAPLTPSEGGIQSTGAPNAPVHLVPTRGALGADEGGIEALPNIEEPEVNQKKEPEDISLPSEAHPEAPPTGTAPAAVVASIGVARPADKHPDLLIYELYPRHEGKGAAMTAIEKAVKRVAVGESEDTMGIFSERCSDIEARRKLYAAVRDYANSPRGQSIPRDEHPHPATWFNQKRYMDDRSIWATPRRDYAKPGTPTKSDRNLTALANVLERRRNSQGTHTAGRGEAGRGDGGRFGTLLLPSGR